MDHNIDLLKEKIRSSADRPGVYQFIASNSQVIYIGKARNIPSRLRSYLNISTSRIANIIKEMNDLKIVYTETESDALLLEIDLIKKYQPKYNVLLKDGAHYTFNCDIRGVY